MITDRRNDSTPASEPEVLRPLAEMQDAILIRRPEKFLLPPPGEFVVLPKSELEHIRSRLQLLIKDNSSYANAGWAVFGVSGSALCAIFTIGPNAPAWLEPTCWSFVGFGGILCALLFYLNRNWYRARETASAREMATLDSAIRRHEQSQPLLPSNPEYPKHAKDAAEERTGTLSDQVGVLSGTPAPAPSRFQPVTEQKIQQP